MKKEERGEWGGVSRILERETRAGADAGALPGVEICCAPSVQYAALHTGINIAPCGCDTRIADL